MRWLAVRIILFLGTQILFAISSFLQTMTPAPPVDHVAHIGGFFTGLLLGAVLVWSMRAPVPKRRIRMRFGFSGIALAMIATLIILVRSDQFSGPVKRDAIIQMTELV